MDGGAGPGGSRDSVVETRALVSLRGEAADALPGILRRLGETLRPSDRVCPVGVTRVAITFGPDAAALSAHRVAGRLADAVRCAPAPPGSVPVALGDLPIVTVDRRVQTRTAAGAAGLGGVVSVPRRTVTTFEGDEVARVPERWATGLHVGVVELPATPRPGRPGLVATAVARALDRIGTHGTPLSAAAVSTPDPDVLVLVLDPEHPRDPGSWEESAWRLGAELAEGHARRGTPVLALAAGADAGALASCVTGGATPVADLRAVETVLCGLAGAEPPGPPPCDLAPDVADAVARIASLTGQERRVLFELTLGRTPGEIADDLTISVTTVRSHIRGVLSKLGVRSQLAAVAAANRRVAPALA